jgi:zinc transporter ZupT
MVTQAMMVQVWTALGAVAGCVIALAAGGYVDSVNWILPFTAGIIIGNVYL